VRNMSRWFPQRSYGVVMRKGKFLSAEARAFIYLIRPGLLTYRDYDEPGHSGREAAGAGHRNPPMAMAVPEMRRAPTSCPAGMRYNASAYAAEEGTRHARVPSPSTSVAYRRCGLAVCPGGNSI